MEKPNKFLEWIKRPHGFLLILVYVGTAIALAGAILLLTLAGDSIWSIVAYGVYGIAAVLVCYSVYTFVIFVPIVKRKITEFAQKYEFTNKLLKEYGFRTIVFLIVSLVFSFAYAVFNGIIGIVEGSIWYGALAAYYLLLVAMRGGILLHRRKKKSGDETEREIKEKKRGIRTYQMIGVMLIVLPVCLSVAIAQMVSDNKGFVHAGLTIYVAATYTFIKIIMSIINFVKARKTEDLTISAVRNVNLADALVSVLALQTAMFREFSSDMQTGLPNALTGAGVCILTVAIGVFMLVVASMQKKTLHVEQNKEEEQNREELTNGEEK